MQQLPCRFVAGVPPLSPSALSGTCGMATAVVSNTSARKTINAGYALERKMRILNLYAGIGGNRKLWEGCQVTAVENQPSIAAAYQGFFPGDTVIVGDAHAYLEQHYSEFDFIWTSPPCPTHGQYRYNIGFRAKGFKAVFPDMKLYEEIIFLKHYFSGLWVVENTRPYYEPLIAPSVILQRHYFWSNFSIKEKQFGATHIGSKNKISDYDIGFDINKTNIKNKRQVLRNCVDSELGKYIQDRASELLTTNGTKAAPVKPAPTQIAETIDKVDSAAS